MDATEQLVFDSDIAVGVLGKGGDFVLVPLDGAIEAAMEAAVLRGWNYCGCYAVTKTGQPGVRCEPDPDSIFTMMYAALAFAQLVAERLRPKPKGDGVEWIEALYRLPDTRG